MQWTINYLKFVSPFFHIFQKKVTDSLEEQICNTKQNQLPVLPQISNYFILCNFLCPSSHKLLIHKHFEIIYDLWHSQFSLWTCIICSNSDFPSLHKISVFRLQFFSTCSINDLCHYAIFQGCFEEEMTQSFRKYWHSLQDVIEALYSSCRTGITRFETILLPVRQLVVEVCNKM